MRLIMDGWREAMTEQELEEFRHRVIVSRANRTASVVVARKLLQEEGVITPEGKLTETFGGDRPKPLVETGPPPKHQTHLKTGGLSGAGG